MNPDVATSAPMCWHIAYSTQQLERHCGNASFKEAGRYYDLESVKGKGIRSYHFQGNVTRSR